MVQLQSFGFGLVLVFFLVHVTRPLNTSLGSVCHVIVGVGQGSETKNEDVMLVENKKLTLQNHTWDPNDDWFIVWALCSHSVEVWCLEVSDVGVVGGESRWRGLKQ